MNSKLKKWTALVCAAAMLTTGMPWVSAAAPPAQVLTTASDFPTDLGRLVIPETLGTIEEAFLTGGNRTVILIQDAHAVPQAQNSIRKLIAYFKKEYGAGDVAFEGAAGSMDTFFLRHFPDQALLKKTMRAYHERAELSGASAAALFDSDSGGYYGAEDWPLFEEGVRFYQEASKKEPERIAQIDREREALDLRKEKAYSPELKRFDERLNAYRVHPEKLAKVLQEANRILPAAQGSALEALIQQIHAEETDAEKLEQGARLALQQFRDSLSSLNKSFPADLNAPTQSFQTGEMSASEFALLLKQAAAKEKIPLSFRSELARQVRMQNKLKQIKGTKLYDELEIYLQSVKASLIRTPEQASLDQESEQLDLLEKIARLELTRDEWEALLKSVRVSRSVQEKNPEAAAFYQNAEKREAAFLERLNGLLNKPQRRGSDAEGSGARHPAVIFVAGGFHSRGLARRLREENIRYLLLTPAIKKLPEKNTYREQMLGGVSWSKYFRIEKGRVNLRDAFLRAVRDDLIKSGARQTAYDESRLLKRWRDDLIRGLADEQRLQDARQYTRFLDEVMAGPGLAKSGSDFPRIALAERLTRFIEGLRRLDSVRQLTEENLFQLLKSNMAQVPAVGGQFADVSLAPDRLGLARLLEQRSEVRTEPAAGVDDALISAVLRQYGIQKAEVTLMDPEKKNVWRVTTQDQKWILKNPLYRITGDLIDWEASVLEKLGDRAAQIQKTSSGENYTASSDGRLYVLYDFVEGREFGWGEVEEENLDHAAQWLARMHQDLKGAALKGAPYTLRQRPQLLSVLDLETGLKKLEMFLDGSQQPRAPPLGALGPRLSANDVSLVRKHIGLLRERLTPSIAAALPKAVIHGDFHQGNLRFQPSGEIRVFDFEYASEDVRVRDLANALTIRYGLDGSSLSVRKIGRFIQTYHAENPLSKEEIRVLPDIFRLSYLEGVWLFGEVNKDQPWAVNPLREQLLNLERLDAQDWNTLQQKLLETARSEVRTAGDLEKKLFKEIAIDGVVPILYILQQEKNLAFPLTAPIEKIEVPGWILRGESSESRIEGADELGGVVLSILRALSARLGFELIERNDNKKFIFGIHSKDAGETLTQSFFEEFPADSPMRENTTASLRMAQNTGRLFAAMHNSGIYMDDSHGEQYVVDARQDVRRIDLPKVRVHSDSFVADLRGQGLTDSSLSNLRVSSDVLPEDDALTEIIMLLSGQGIRGFELVEPLFVIPFLETYLRERQKVSDSIKPILEEALAQSREMLAQRSEVRARSYESTQRMVSQFRLLRQPISQEKLRLKDQGIADLVGVELAQLVSEDGRVLEIGTGLNGILTRILARAKDGKNVSFVATDIDAEAAESAAKQLEDLPNVTVRTGDLFSPVEGEKFDAIFWNPPWYPQLRPGKRNGLAYFDQDHAALKRYLREAPRHLTERGEIFVILPRELSAVLWESAPGLRLTLEEVSSRKTRRFNVALYSLKPMEGALVQGGKLPTGRFETKTRVPAKNVSGLFQRSEVRGQSDKTGDFKGLEFVVSIPAAENWQLATIYRSAFQKQIQRFLKEAKLREIVLREMSLSEKPARIELDLVLPGLSGHGRFVGKLMTRAVNADGRTVSQKEYALKMAAPDDESGFISNDVFEEELEISERYKDNPRFQKHFARTFFYKTYPIPKKELEQISREAEEPGYSEIVTFELDEWREGETLEQLLEKAASPQEVAVLFERVIRAAVESWHYLEGLLFDAGADDVLLTSEGGVSFVDASGRVYTREGLSHTVMILSDAMKAINAKRGWDLAPRTVFEKVSESLDADSGSEFKEVFNAYFGARPEVRVPIKSVTDLFHRAGVPMRDWQTTSQGLHVGTQRLHFQEIVSVFPLPDKEPFTVFDAGSGQGVFALRLAASRPNARITGVESDVQLWSDSQKVLAQAVKEGSVGAEQVQFLKDDFNSAASREKMRRADYVYYYDSGTEKPQTLSSSLIASMRPGARLVVLSSASGSAFTDDLLETGLFQEEPSPGSLWTHVLLRNSKPARSEMRAHALSELDFAPQYRRILEGFRQARVPEEVIRQMEAEVLEILEHQPPFLLRQGKPLLNLFRIFDPALDGRVTEFVSTSGAVYALLSEAFSKKAKDFYNHDNLTALYFASQIAAQTTESGDPRYDLLSIGHKIKSEEAGGAVPDAMLFDRELEIYLIAEFRAGHGTFPRLLQQKKRQTLNYLRLLLNADLEALTASDETILPQYVFGQNPSGLIWAVDKSFASIAGDEAWSVEGAVRNRLQALVEEARQELVREGIPVRNDFDLDQVWVEFLDQTKLYAGPGTIPAQKNALAITPEDWEKVSSILDSLYDTPGFSGFSGLMNSDLYALAKKLNWLRPSGQELSLEEIYNRYLSLGATFEERMAVVSELLRGPRPEVRSSFGHKDGQPGAERLNIENILDQAFEFKTPAERKNRELRILDIGTQLGHFMVNIKQQLEALGYRVTVKGVEPKKQLGIAPGLQMHQGRLGPENFIFGAVTASGEILTRYDEDWPKVQVNESFDLIFANAPDFTRERNIYEWILKAYQRYRSPQGLGFIRLYEGKNFDETMKAQDGRILEASIEAHPGISTLELDRETTPVLARGTHEVGPLILLSPRPLTQESLRSEVRSQPGGFTDFQTEFGEEAENILRFLGWNDLSLDSKINFDRKSESGRGTRTRHVHEYKAEDGRVFYSSEYVSDQETPAELLAVLRNEEAIQNLAAEAEVSSPAKIFETPRGKVIIQRAWPGKRIWDLNSEEEVRAMGHALGLLHRQRIRHGDLTYGRGYIRENNILLNKTRKEAPQIGFIDFEFSKKDESPEGLQGEKRYVRFALYRFYGISEDRLEAFDQAYEAAVFGTLQAPFQPESPQDSSKPTRSEMRGRGFLHKGRLAQTSFESLRSAFEKKPVPVGLRAKVLEVLSRQAESYGGPEMQALFQQRLDKLNRADFKMYSVPPQNLGPEDYFEGQYDEAQNKLYISADYLDFLEGQGPAVRYYEDRLLHEVLYPAQRVLVLGASGFLGGEIFNRLGLVYPDVTGTTHTQKTDKLFIPLDLTREADVLTLIERENPDVIIYAAAVADVPTAEKEKERALLLNAGVPEMLARHFKGRLIYLSTDYVFNGRQVPYEASASPSPLNFYGETKARGEDAVLASPQNTVIRLGLPFGADRPVQRDLIQRLVMHMEGFKEGDNPLVLDNVQIRHPVLVADIVQLVTGTVHQKTPGILQINGETGMTQFQFAQAVEKAYRTKHRREFTGFKLAKGPFWVPADASVEPEILRPQNAKMVNTAVATTPFDKALDAAIYKHEDLLYTHFYEALLTGDTKKFNHLGKMLARRGVRWAVTGNPEKLSEWQGDKPVVYDYSQRTLVREVLKKRFSISPVSRIRIDRAIDAGLLNSPESELQILLARKVPRRGGSFELSALTSSRNTNMLNYFLLYGYMESMNAGAGLRKVWVPLRESEDIEESSRKLQGGSFSSVHRLTRSDGSTLIEKRAHTAEDGGKLMAEALYMRRLQENGGPAGRWFPSILSIDEEAGETVVQMEDVPWPNLTQVIQQTFAENAYSGIFETKRAALAKKSQMQVLQDIYRLLTPDFYSQVQSPTPPDFIERYHFKKVDERWKLAANKSEFVRRLLEAPYLEFTDQTPSLMPNLDLMMNFLRGIAVEYPQLLMPPYLSKQHGDLHVGNILVDPFDFVASGEIQNLKLIDPKYIPEGNDPLYDFAKLLHNYFGHYDLALEHSQTFHFTVALPKENNEPARFTSYFDDDAEGTAQMLSRIDMFNQEVAEFLVNPGSDRLFPFEKDPIAWRMRLLFTHATLMAGLLPYHTVGNQREYKVGIIYERTAHLLYMILNGFHAQGLMKGVPGMQKAWGALEKARDQNNRPAFEKALAQAASSMSKFKRSEVRSKTAPIFLSEEEKEQLVKMIESERWFSVLRDQSAGSLHDKAIEDALASEKLPQWVVKIPRPSIRPETFDYAKKRLGGLMAPFTVLRNVKINGRERPWVIVQARRNVIRDTHGLPDEYVFPEGQEVVGLWAQERELIVETVRRGVFLGDALIAKNYGVSEEGKLDFIDEMDSAPGTYDSLFPKKTAGYPRWGRTEVERGFDREFYKGWTPSHLEEIGLPSDLELSQLFNTKPGDFPVEDVSLPEGTRSEVRSTGQEESPLAEILREQIRENGGAITFRDFMETSLYHPQHGYYTGGHVSLGGNDGWYDFSTYVEKAPAAFAEGLLNHMLVMWEKLGQPKQLQIVEMGAGRGVLAAHILQKAKAALARIRDEGGAQGVTAAENKRLRRFLKSLDYVIVEISDDLRRQQQDMIRPVLTEPVISNNQIADSEMRVRWAPFAAHQIKGTDTAGQKNPLAVSMPRIFISNELPDAFPVHRVRAKVREGRYFEYQEAFVQVDSAGRFVETWRPLESAQALRIEMAIQNMGKVYEDRLRAGGEVAVNLQALEWQGRLAALFKRSSKDRGYVITLDYGFPGKRYIPDNKMSVRSYAMNRPFVFLGIKIRNSFLLKTIRLVVGAVEDLIKRFPPRVMRWLYRINPLNLFEADDAYFYENPGRTDITADVDFDMLDDLAERLGLATEAMTSQGYFFELAGLPKDKVDALNHPGFFAMVQSKGVEGALYGEAPIQPPVWGQPKLDTQRSEVRAEDGLQRAMERVTMSLNQALDPRASRSVTEILKDVMLISLLIKNGNPGGFSDHDQKRFINDFLGLATALQEPRSQRDRFVKAAVEPINLVLKRQGRMLFYSSMPASKEPPSFHLLDWGEVQSQANRIASQLTLRVPGQLRSILVAEDLLIPEYEFWAKELQQKWGIQVLVKPNGREGLEELTQSSSRYDLMISDVNMPEMTGPAMMNAFSQSSPQSHDLPAVYVTDVNLEALQPQREAGRDYAYPPVQNWKNRAYLEKPAIHFDVYTLTVLSEVIAVLRSRAEVRSGEDSDRSLKEALDALKVKGLIYNLDFIRAERARAAAQPTVAFDMDETLTRAIGESPNKFYDLRPGMEQLLKDLKAEGVRLVLWTSAGSGSVRRMFGNHPHLLNLFNLVIASDNYLVKTDPDALVQWQTAYQEADQDQVQRYRETHYVGQGHTLPKDIALLGYRVLVDDRESWIDAIAESPFYESAGRPHGIHISSYRGTEDEDQEEAYVLGLKDQILKLLRSEVRGAAEEQPQNSRERPELPLVDSVEAARSLLSLTPIRPIQQSLRSLPGSFYRGVNGEEILEDVIAKKVIPPDRPGDGADWSDIWPAIRKAMALHEEPFDFGLLLEITSGTADKYDRKAVTWNWARSLDSVPVEDVSRAWLITADLGTPKQMEETTRAAEIRLPGMPVRSEVRTKEELDDFFSAHRVDQATAEQEIRAAAQAIFKGRDKGVFQDKLEPAVVRWADGNVVQYSKRLREILNLSLNETLQSLPDFLIRQTPTEEQIEWNQKIRRTITLEKMTQLALAALRKEASAAVKNGQVYPITGIRFFGSLVTGKLISTSDIDFVMDAPTDSAESYHDRFEDAFEKVYTDFIRANQLMSRRSAYPRLSSLGALPTDTDIFEVPIPFIRVALEPSAKSEVRAGKDIQPGDPAIAIPGAQEKAAAIAGGLVRALEENDVTSAEIKETVSLTVEIGAAPVLTELERIRNTLQARALQGDTILLAGKAVDAALVHKRVQAMVERLRDGLQSDLAGEGHAVTYLLPADEAGAAVLERVLEKFSPRLKQVLFKKDAKPVPTDFLEKVRKLGIRVGFISGLKNAPTFLTDQNYSGLVGTEGEVPQEGLSDIFVPVVQLAEEQSSTDPLIQELELAMQTAIALLVADKIKKTSDRFSLHTQAVALLTDYELFAGFENGILRPLPGGGIAISGMALESFLADWAARQQIEIAA